jgi:hypothetical protein
MLFSVTNATATHQPAKQLFMRTNFERRDLEQLLEVSEKFVLRSAFDEPFEQGHSPVLETTPLRKQPAGETRAALYLQSFEEIAAEQREQSPRLRRRQAAETFPGGALYFQRIDEIVGEAEPNAIIVTSHASGPDDPT